MKSKIKSVNLICTKRSSPSRLSHLWCFGFDFGDEHCVSDEPFKDKATRMIDSVLFEKYGPASFKEILVRFSDGEMDNSDATLVRKCSQDDGTIYSLINSRHGI